MLLGSAAHEHLRIESLPLPNFEALPSVDNNGAIIEADRLYRVILAAVHPTQRDINSAVDSLHVWVLCHVLRRPIIVFNTDDIQQQRNTERRVSTKVTVKHGIYLPYFVSRNNVYRVPICLGVVDGNIVSLVQANPKPKKL